MGRIREPLPVKLLVPMLCASPDLLADAIQALVEHYGPVDYISTSIPFTYTDYYAIEMGVRLERSFVSFATLVDQGSLAETKLLTNDLEQRWSVEGRRQINLDPGHLSPGKLVLATTKDQAHRVYLGKGIYAEVTLAFRAGDFSPWPWTYPDYRSQEYLAILREMRTLYMGQLRAAHLL